MDRHEHTTRLTEAGFVICVCGWATAAADEEPREAAATHIAETGPADTVPVWVERPGGRVCVPGNGHADPRALETGSAADPLRRHEGTTHRG